MITHVQALGYRSLRYISQSLRPFQILVGPNASGKTTFLDVVSFLGQLVSEGLEVALNQRTNNLLDLLWGRTGDSFELAIDLKTASEEYPFARYEVKVGTEEPGGEVALLSERLLLMTEPTPDDPGPPVFPHFEEPPGTILYPKSGKNRKTVVSKSSGGTATFNAEPGGRNGKGWNNSIRLGPKKSALANLPEDETTFPVATWVKEFLKSGVQQLNLNSLLLRRPSPPNQPRGFKPDGSNLPWIVRALKVGNPERFRAWVRHVGTALLDVKDVIVVERDEDRHAYLKLRYRSGLEVPSWMVSDGSLRLLALTVLAYLPNPQGAVLIEEPENGIHPRAVETVFQSLASVYDSQTLIATHSPVVLGIAQPRDVLCFARRPEGGTDIVAGNLHPALRDWKQEVSLGTLYASGVLE